MKTLSLITILSLLIIATGCGSNGQSDSKLKISRAFAMANSNFPGGLIVTGKKVGTTKSFSVSLTDSMTTNIQLEQGTWRFAAVGWDGNKPFGGDTSCGWVEKNLANSQETIDLVISKAKCTDTETDGINFFAGGLIDSFTTPVKFKKLSRLATCNTFYKLTPTPSNTLSSLDLATPGNWDPTFCNALPQDLKGRVESFKIRSVKKLVNESIPSAGLDSGCFNMNNDTVSSLGSTGQPFTAAEVGPHLPFNNIPFIIEVYEESNCNRYMGNYYFKRGLKEGFPENFDHILRGDGSNTASLLLPGNDLKRARSPFAALLPYFKKDDGTTKFPFETLPSTMPDLYITRGSPQKFVLEAGSCTITGATGVGSPVCISLADGKKEITLNVTGTGDGSGSFTLDGNTYTVYIADTVESFQRHATQKILLDLVGTGNSNLSTSFFFPVEDEEAEDYGVLKEAREMLSGAGALGGMPAASTFQEACQNASVSKEFLLYEPEVMAFRKYKLEISNNTEATPTKYFCDTANKSPSSCTISFNRRMSIWFYHNSTIVPTFVTEFNCSKMVGKMEVFFNEIKGSSKYTENMIVSWNTQPTSLLVDQRFEVLKKRTQHAYNSTTKMFDVLKGETRKMARVAKIGALDLEVHHFDYGAHFDSALGKWRQHLDSHQIISTNATSTTLDVCTLHNGSAMEDNDRFAVFGDIYADDPVVSGALGNIKYQANGSSFTAATNSCTGMNTFTSQLFVDTTADGVANDDNGSDKIDASLPLRLDTLNSPLFLGKFGTTFQSP